MDETLKVHYIGYENVLLSFCCSTEVELSLNLIGTLIQFLKGNEKTNEIEKSRTLTYTFRSRIYYFIIHAVC